MNKTDEGIIITYDDIDNISRTLGYVAITMLAARLIGYILAPTVIRVDA